MIPTQCPHSIHPMPPPIRATTDFRFFSRYPPSNIICRPLLSLHGFSATRGTAAIFSPRRTFFFNSAREISHGHDPVPDTNGFPEIGFFNCTLYPETLVSPWRLMAIESSVTTPPKVDPPEILASLIDLVCPPRPRRIFLCPPPSKFDALGPRLSYAGFFVFVGRLI